MNTDSRTAHPVNENNKEKLSDEEVGKFLIKHLVYGIPVCKLAGGFAVSRQQLHRIARGESRKYAYDRFMRENKYRIGRDQS